MFEDMKQYLLSLQISDEDKRYALNFCRKMKYLEDLRSKVANDTKMNVNAGYGNLNSSVCFIFNNPKNFKIIKSYIQEKLDLFDVNLWQTYVTFIDKIEKNYHLKYDMICAEISAIKPKVIYIFDNNKDNYDKVMNSLNKMNKQFIPERIIFININDLISDDEEIKKKIWFDLHYLINYKPS